MIYKDREVSSIESKAKKTQGKTFLPGDIDPSMLQIIHYQYPRRKITVELNTNEFTCICPFSGLPDFANLIIKYIPAKKLIEMKSLKYYLYSYRNVKIYNEHVVNKILEDLKNILLPYELWVIGDFTVRGGIRNRASAHYKKR